MKGKHLEPKLVHCCLAEGNPAKTTFPDECAVFNWLCARWLFN
jgi:hypothetical protein